MPVSTEERSVHDADIRTDIFDLLGIPERESIIVTMSDEDALLAHRIQIVSRHLDRGTTVASVVVVPVLLRHEGRHEKASQCQCACGGSRIFVFQCSADPVEQCHSTESDPDAERIERPGISIVTFTHLIRRLVKVHDNGDSRHEEQQERQPAAPLVPLELEEQAEDAQQQRQKVVMVLALVVFQHFRSIALVTETQLVNGRDAAFPVSVEQFARARAVYVVLPSGEVPHEVSPVHPVQLEIEEEVQVRPERRFLVVGPRNRTAFAASV